MRLFNKLLSVMAVSIYLAGIALADSAGIVFDWQPFIVNDYMELNQPSKNIVTKNLFTSEKIWEQYDDIEELLHTDLKMMDNAPKVTTKKSALSKIKITVSPVNYFMMPGDENYSSGKDGKISQAARTLPSFFRNPSQGTAVETLKLIEPQVNFGFEF